MFERFNEIQKMLAEPFGFGESPAPSFDRSLPASYVHLASSRYAAEILHKYSNTDKFWFTPYEEDIVSTPVGEILLYNRESQGNFQIGIVLEPDEPDPPVMYSDFRGERWVEYCERFTDAIYTQIFDWQYLLCFSEEWGSEIDYYETVDVPNFDETLSACRGAFNEHPHTNWFFDTPSNATTWRFSTEDGERILLIDRPVSPDKPHATECSLMVMAPQEDRAERVKNLCKRLSAHFV